MRRKKKVRIGVIRTSSEETYTKDAEESKKLDKTYSARRGHSLEECEKEDGRRGSGQP